MTLNKTLRPESLDEFAQKVDAVLGRETDLARAVRGYCLARDIGAVFKPSTEWRVELDAGVKSVYRQGIGPDQHHKIVEISRGGGTKRAVRAPRVKEKFPNLYEAARVKTTVVNIDGPAATVWLPSNKGPCVFSALEYMAAKRAEGRDLNAVSKEVILGVVEDMGWEPGEAWVTSDGWQIGHSVQRRFSEVRLLELLRQNGKDAEELDLMQEVAVPLVTHYRLVQQEPAMDMDEIST